MKTSAKLGASTAVQATPSSPSEGLRTTFNYILNNIASMEERTSEIEGSILGEPSTNLDSAPIPGSLVGMAEQALQRLQNLHTRLGTLTTIL